MGDGDCTGYERVPRGGRSRSRVGGQLYLANAIVHRAIGSTGSCRDSEGVRRLVVVQYHCLRRGDRRLLAVLGPSPAHGFVVREAWHKMTEVLVRKSVFVTRSR